MGLGINNAGQVVGAYEGADIYTSTHGFLLNGTGYTSIDYPGYVPGPSNFTVATSINNLGQIVGYYDDISTGQHGFLKDSAGFTSFDVPAFIGGDSIRPHGVNDKGQIVGDYNDASGYHGFLKDGTSFAPLFVPGSILTDAIGINNAGQIVGAYNDVAGNTHGFLRSRTGSYVTIDYPGAYYTAVSGINNAGLMVGQYVDGTGEHGFTVSVVPEPSTLAIAGLSGTLLLGYAWCRRRLRS